IFNLKEQLKTFNNGNQIIQQLKNLNYHKSSNKFKNSNTQSKNLNSIGFNDKSTLINKYIKRIKVTSDDVLKLYNIGIHFVIPITEENYVMDYYKRIPFVDTFMTL